MTMGSTDLLRRCDAGHWYQPSIVGPTCPVCAGSAAEAQHQAYRRRWRPLILFAALIAILLLIGIGFAGITYYRL